MSREGYKGVFGRSILKVYLGRIVEVIRDLVWGLIYSCPLIEGMRSLSEEHQKPYGVF